MGEKKAERTRGCFKGKFPIKRFQMNLPENTGHNVEDAKTG